MNTPSYIDNFKNDTPRTIYLYATDVCNSNCVYCIFRKSNSELPRNIMSFHLIREIWNQSRILSNYGSPIGGEPKVVLQGGEFTTHPSARAILGFFADLRIPTVLLTNAIGVDADLASLAGAITISFDGPNHDKSRGAPGNLLEVKALTQKLVELGKDVTLQMTLGPWNLRQGDITRVLDYVRDTGYSLRFNFAENNGLLGILHTSTNMDDFKQAVDIIQEYQARYLGSIKLSDVNVRYLRLIADGRTSSIACMSTSLYSTILANGNVLLCQGDPIGFDRAPVIGNLLHHVEGSAFDNIWHDSRTTRRRSTKCRNCSLSCQMLGDIAIYKEMSDVITL